MKDLRHIGLALALAVVWGTNFVVIKIGLRDFPPFAFALLRFTLSAIPFVFFFARPAVEWRWLVLFGTFLGAGQFGLLFYAMRSDISPGLASLVIQMQVFFTIALSMWIFGERLSRAAIAGTLAAVAGLALIAMRLDASATHLGVVLVLAAAFAWACANIAVKMAAARAKKRFGMLAFVVWGSLFAIPPLFALTTALEGAGPVWRAIAGAHLDAWGAVVWQVVGNTLFAFGAWNYLLARYDASVVTPWALLVPVFGMGSSALLLGEGLPAWKLGGGALVLCGIAIIVAANRPRRLAER